MEKNNILLKAQERYQEINEIRKNYFIKGVHFGEIPGIKRQILFKSGAELLMQIYGLVPHFKETIESVGPMDRRILVTASICETEGRVVGNGYGFASSLEDRYKWRKSTGKDEFDSAPESERRTVRAGGELIYQVRQNPDNCLNTIVKMARKRAIVDAVLTIFSISAYFTQDFEDETAPATLPQFISDREPRKTSKDNNRTFLKAVDELQKQYGSNKLSEAEQTTGVSLRSLATKERALQVQGYKRVRSFLRVKSETAVQGENLFQSA